MDQATVVNIFSGVANSGVVIYFVKKWMDGIESSIKSNAQERKESIALLSNQINQVHEQVIKANGRTGTLESKVAVLHEICQERHK